MPHFKSLFLHLYTSLVLMLISIPGLAFVVVIDPGHGGRDSGATRGSFKESLIVLELAQKLAEELKKNPEIQVELTRETNKLIPLQSRVDLANQKKADLFISLHANSSTSGSVTGMEFYFNGHAPQLIKNKNSSETEIIKKITSDLVHFGKTNASLELSKSIQGNVLETKSVIRRAPFYVIENTTMPSVLIEVGFISNLREARKLITAEYQSELVQILTRSVHEYKEKSDKLIVHR